MGVYILSKCRCNIYDDYFESICDIEAYEHLYNQKLKYLLINQFEISIKQDNKPIFIRPQFVDNFLYHYGATVVFYDDIVNRLIALPCSVQRWNVLGEPEIVRAWSPYASYETVLYKDKDKFVVIYDIASNLEVVNSTVNERSATLLSVYETTLAQLTVTININNFYQRMPLILYGDDSSMLSAKNFFRKFEGGVPFIPLKKQPDGVGLDQQFKLFNLNAPYVGDKLQNERREIWNELLETIGYKVNMNTNKKERLITQEVGGNTEETIGFYENRKAPRVLAIELLSDMFPEYQFELIEKTEVKENEDITNGNLYYSNTDDMRGISNDQDPGNRKNDSKSNNSGSPSTDI